MRRASTLVALCALAAACRSGEPGPRSFEFAGATMGTTYTVKVVADELSEPRRAALDGAIVGELDRVVRLMSHYEEASELSRFNRHEGTDPFPISPETAEVFRWALEIGRETGGALDVTVGPLVDAWGFGPPGQPAEPPDEATLRRLLEATGNGQLTLDLEAPSLAKAGPEIRCDLSAVAKGYAVDRIADRLVAMGYERFLVEVGGELRVEGRNESGEPWQLAVERPQESGRSVFRMVPMLSGAMATSGDYRNYQEIDGERVSHIIDPRTGHPVGHRLASVSVIDPLCVRADGFATALLVLGPDEGFRLAEELDLPALFLVRQEDGSFRQRATLRFEELAPLEETSRRAAALQ